MTYAPAPERPTGLRAPDSGPDSTTRATMALWDRIKILLVLATAFLVLVWHHLAGFEGISTFADSARTIAAEGGGTIVLCLVAAEALRQVHFLVSERSARYHRFWSRSVFGGFDRWTRRRFSDWNRYRIARALKWLFWIALLALVLGQILDVSPAIALFEAPALLWQVLPYGLQLAFGFVFVMVQFVGLFWFLSRGGIETYYPDDIKTRFSDVWGQDHVVERVKENIVFLERPGEIEARGGYVPGGLLLWGPPGTGKTLMAEAVAGETGKPYVFVDPGAFINMFMGIGVLKVKSLFRKLRKLALRYGGVIVFFDEADSLGRRGALAQQGPPGGAFSGTAAFSGGGCHGFSYLSGDTRALLTRHALTASAGAATEGSRRDRVVAGMGMGAGGGDLGTLQALLTELSGLKKPRGFVNRYVRRLLGMRPKPPPKYRILVMMATNMPNSLDEALLRPGRIDRIYKVGYPSKAGRVRTYQGYFDKVRHQLTPDQIDKLATITPYATGATIKDLVNESLITAIRAGREVITWGDVMIAKRLKQLGPPEDVEYIERERHAVAVHEACHAVAAYRTRFHLEIDIATIEKGADYLGMVSSIKPEDQFTRWRSEYESDIIVSLASLAGERMFFGDDNSSGVSGDLEHATTVTGHMEAYWGMGVGVAHLPALQLLGIRDGKAAPSSRGAGSAEEPAGAGAPDTLAERIEFNLARLLERTEELLRENRREILSVAHALEQHKTLNGDDVIAVIERTRGPLVDGTVYASDAFYEQLEAYHDLAAAAHHSHSPVTSPLPWPPSPSPWQTSSSSWPAPAPQTIPGQLLPPGHPDNAGPHEHPADSQNGGSYGHPPLPQNGGVYGSPALPENRGTYGYPVPPQTGGPQGYAAPPGNGAAHGYSVPPQTVGPQGYTAPPQNGGAHAYPTPAQTGGPYGDQRNGWNGGTASGPYAGQGAWPYGGPPAVSRTDPQVAQPVDARGGTAGTPRAYGLGGVPLTGPSFAPPGGHIQDRAAYPDVTPHSADGGSPDLIPWRPEDPRTAPPATEHDQGHPTSTNPTPSVHGPSFHTPVGQDSPGRDSSGQSPVPLLPHASTPTGPVPPGSPPTGSSRPATAPVGGSLPGDGAQYGMSSTGPRPVRPVVMALGAAAALVLFVLAGVAVFGGSTPADGGEAMAGPSTSGIAAMLAGLVLLLVGGVVAVMVVRGQQAARRRAEETRNRAVERAQLLAAAMEPEAAMRLLGYDPNDHHSPGPRPDDQHPR
ncbi:AAA family ATPase [Sphaerisporangium album]|uniref:AAA family ATPase n=1 Tax=Sphaerisporangium album TaxID=509200 RepID=A0A367FGF0_9ACTN|nr:AAA family ATPase [Sphaerisporangium album]RCG29401.1 AAA family ATPase [Sphaerisporangium album]